MDLRSAGESLGSITGGARERVTNAFQADETGHSFAGKLLVRGVVAVAGVTILAGLHYEQEMALMGSLSAGSAQKVDGFEAVEIEQFFGASSNPNEVNEADVLLSSGKICTLSYTTHYDGARFEWLRKAVNTVYQNRATIVDTGSCPPLKAAVQSKTPSKKTTSKPSASPSIKAGK